MQNSNLTKAVTNSYSATSDDNVSNATLKIKTKKNIAWLMFSCSVQNASAGTTLTFSVPDMPSMEDGVMVGYNGSCALIAAITPSSKTIKLRITGSGSVSGGIGLYGVTMV